MTREMTTKQFYAALRRNGFEKPVLFWVKHRDFPNHSLSMTFYRDGRIARRDTIGNLIKRRDELEQEKARHDERLRK